MTARRFLVSGSVQGVGYRWFVARAARALGLNGAARNLSDGRVEVIAAGPEAALAELERSLHSGPGTARVAEVEVHEVADEAGVPKGFAIG